MPGKNRVECAPLTVAKGAVIVAHKFRLAAPLDTDDTDGEWACQKSAQGERSAEMGLTSNVKPRVRTPASFSTIKHRVTMGTL